MYKQIFLGKQQNYQTIMMTGIIQCLDPQQAIIHLQLNRVIFTMGDIFSSKAKKSQLQDLYTSKLYQSKMYCQNKKTQDIFMRQVKHLCKKLSYIQYSWGQHFSNSIQHICPQRLYSQYSYVLQQNCRRDGSCEIIFYALKLREMFLREISKKYNTSKSILTIAKLKELIEQTKCYFMVMNWLQGIGSLEQAKAEEMDQPDSQIFVVFMHEERVYNLVIEAASRTYVEHLEKEEISKLWLGELQSQAEFKNSEVVYHLKQIKKYINFHDRQKQIICLQQTLSNLEQTVSDKLLYLIQKVFGRSKIFGYLLVIREIGHFDISYLWTKIYGNLYNDLFH